MTEGVGEKMVRVRVWISSIQQIACGKYNIKVRFKDLRHI